MVPEPADTGRAAAVPDHAAALRILALVRADDLDGAIEAGLARCVPIAGLDAADNGALLEARDRLLAAWAARERHRARAQRLEDIAQERRRARSARPEQRPAPVQADTDPAHADANSPARPALPSAAAAALARARARTSGAGS